MQMEYNFLDLPTKVAADTTILVNYSYLADGTKTSSLKASGEGLVYRGPFTYRIDSYGNIALESVACPEGRLTPEKALLYVTDHLGSVRAVVDGNTGAVLEASDYSVYGTRSGHTLAIDIGVIAPGISLTLPGSDPGTFPGFGGTTPATITYRDHFTGQEDQMPDFGIPYIDHGARHYSPALRRWMTPDSLSEKYYGLSPYNYCDCNPVNAVDLDGRLVGRIIAGAISATTDFAIQTASMIIMDGKTFSEAIKSVDYVDVGMSAVEGFATMGASSSVKAVTKIVTTAVSSSIDASICEGVTTNDFGTVAKQAFFSMVTSKVGKKRNFSPHTKSPNKVVSGARKTAHDSGRSLSASEAKAVKSAAQASNEIKKEAVKGVEDGLVDAQANAAGTISRKIYEKIDEK